MKPVLKYVQSFIKLKGVHAYRLCKVTNEGETREIVFSVAVYGRKLEEDIISETSGHFRKLLVSMSVVGFLLLLLLFCLFVYLFVCL